MKAISLTTTQLLLLFVSANCDGSGPTFRYVTSYNRPGRFITRDDVEKTTVNALEPIIFIVNGLEESEKQGDSWNKQLADAYTEKQIHNVFIVDWDVETSQPEPVAASLADFVNALFVKTDENHLDIHLVGMAAGGDVAGRASDRLLGVYERRVNRITALEPGDYPINGPGPAASGFLDAVSSIPLFSEGKPTSTSNRVDFYVDFDDRADKCQEKEEKKRKTCKVLRIAEIFAKSVNRNDIKAAKCDGSESFKKGLCDGEERVVFGENVPTETRGKYFLKV